jgi:hypothetical protein
VSEHDRASAPVDVGQLKLGHFTATQPQVQRATHDRVVATPSTATLFNQGTACVTGVSRAPAANLRSVCSAMATTPLLLAFSSRA